MMYTYNIQYYIQSCRSPSRSSSPAAPFGPETRPRHVPRGPRKPKSAAPTTSLKGCGIVEY